MRSLSAGDRAWPWLLAAAATACWLSAAGTESARVETLEQRAAGASRRAGALFPTRPVFARQAERPGARAAVGGARSSAGGEPAALAPVLGSGGSVGMEPAFDRLEPDELAAQDRLRRAGAFDRGAAGEGATRSGAPKEAGSPPARLGSEVRAGRESGARAMVSPVPAGAPGLPAGPQARTGAPVLGLAGDTLFREEVRVEEVWRSHWRRFEEVRRFEEDWSSRADLARLSAQYKEDHDPAAFLRGLAAAPGFPAFAARHAGSPALAAMTREMAAGASAGAVSWVVGLLGRDMALGAFVTGLDRTLRDQGGYSLLAALLPTPKPIPRIALKPVRDRTPDWK